MRPFLLMAIAGFLHVGEEYVYPGGFLRWMRLLFSNAVITPTEAVVVNSAFLLLVLSPFFGPPEASPVLNLSIPILLIANGALHVFGTFATKRYSPGVVTSVVLFFPAAIDALSTLPRKWDLPTTTLVRSILLGVGWQLIPLVRMAVRRIQGITH